MKEKLKVALLKVLVTIPIISIAFAAQSALAISDYNYLETESDLSNKSLFIDGIEYNLQRVLNASYSEYVGDLPIWFIIENQESILNGKFEGIEIDDSTTLTKDGGSISGV